MKKRIAIFADGCGYEYMGPTFSGIKSAASEAGVDIYAFVSYAFRDESTLENIGELNVFTLPDLKKFDGMLLMSHTFNFTGILRTLFEQLQAADIPTVCLESRLGNYPVVQADNVSGTYELTNHLIRDHKVHEIVYISGIDVGEESRLRLQGIMKSLEENGMELDPGNILFGDWEYETGRKLVRKWLQEHPGHLPDAIMAANDMMALGACEVLNENGYEVPRDVIVTGYDNLESARIYSPGITSVNRRSEEIGYRGLNHLLGIIEGKSFPDVERIPIGMAVEESCGCFNQYRNTVIRNTICKKNVIRNIEKVEIERKNWAMKRDMSGCASVNELSDVLIKHLSESDLFGGRDLAVMLDSAFLQAAMGKDQLHTEGYGDRMDVLISRQKGAVRYGDVLYREQLMPLDSEQDSYSHGYFFLPLHGLEKSYGYVVFCDTWNQLPDLTLNTWVDAVSQGLLQVFQSIHLEQLNQQLYDASVHDLPTGLYNRTGYDKVVIPSVRARHRDGQDSTLVIVDINRMKQINDRDGHLEGDKAIRTVADVLRELTPEGWYAVRYGGDEFLMMGPALKPLALTEFQALLQPRLDVLAEERGMKRRLMVSFGNATILGSMPLDLDQAIKDADAKMYVMKERLHAMDEVE